MNGIGLIIALACQAVSRYVLGFESVTADFVAGAIIGLILGTIFRFLAYRFFVFTEELDGDPAFAGITDAASAKTEGHPGEVSEPERVPSNSM